MILQILFEVEVADEDLPELAEFAWEQAAAVQQFTNRAEWDEYRDDAPEFNDIKEIMVARLWADPVPTFLELIDIR